ncbi:iron chelate uptake ABC transporter family permease subunit [Frankia sp. AgKG'84/4]
MTGATSAPPRASTPAAAPAAVPTPNAAQPVRGGLRSARARAAALVGAVLALAGMCLLSLWVGANHLALPVVWRVLWHDDGSQAALIVHDLRVPRTLLGLSVGAALGAAGALTQALTRNDLAEPGILGLGYGAAAAVVTGISAFGVLSPAGYVWFAFAGVGITAVAVFSIGSAGRGASQPANLVVAGAAASAVLGAFVNAVLLLDTRTFDQFRFWDVGSLAAPGSAALRATWPYIAVGLLVAIGLARPLNALALGDCAARGLGVQLGRARALGGLAIVLLCGAATAAAGPITFVGLAVPHVARAIAGPDYRWVLPYSAVGAAILLLGADMVGRVIIAPGELEVGIVTAFVGAPVFIALCRRARLARS